MPRGGAAKSEVVTQEADPAVEGRRTGIRSLFDGPDLEKRMEALARDGKAFRENEKLPAVRRSRARLARLQREL